MIMISQKSADEKCKLEIVLQPCKTISMHHSTKRECKVYSDIKTESRKPFIGPKVKIKNHPEPFTKTIIRCFLFTAEEDEKNRGPHIYKLIDDKNKRKDELVRFYASQKNQFTACFDYLKIIKPKMMAQVEFYERNLCAYYGKENQSKNRKNLEDINLNEMCLKFEAFIEKEGSEIQICDPVFSQTIVNEGQQKKRKSGSGVEEPPKKKRLETGESEESLKLEIRSTFDKIMLKSSHSNGNNTGILQTLVPFNIDAGQRQDERCSIVRIEGSVRDIVSSESESLLPKNADKNSLLSTGITDESSVSSIISDVLDLEDEYINNKSSVHFVLLQGGRSKYSLSSSSSSSTFGEEEELLVDSPQNPIPAEDEEELYTNISAIMEDTNSVDELWREVLPLLCFCMNDIETGHNSSTCWRKCLENIYKWKNIFIALLILMFIWLYNQNVGVACFSVLLWNAPRGRNIHWNKFRITFKTIITLYAVLVGFLLWFTIYKFTIWILIYLLHTKKISSERKLKWILTFGNLLIKGVGLSGQIFDDRVHQQLGEMNNQRIESIALIKGSKVKELIELLRKQRHNLRLIDPYDLQMLYRNLLLILRGFLYVYLLYVFSTFLLQFR